MSYETILLETAGAVATIRLNRPERMNAVIEQMYRELAAALDRIRADETLRSVVLTGSVRRKDGVDKQAFCAGADLKKHSSGERSAEQRRAYIELAHDTVRRLHRLPKPVVAAINGPARGAGTELALACDFILIAEDATLGLPEIGLGTFVGGGATHLLPRRVGPARAKELIYTGRVLDGRTAQAWGLALRCCPLERLAHEAEELAAVLAQQAPLSLAAAKRALDGPAAADFDAALAAETETILECMASEDWREGLLAFAEKRAPRFRGR